MRSTILFSPLIFYSSCAFNSPAGPSCLLRQRHNQASTWCFAEGDPLRAATGIRPSLHPTTINAIAEALKLRCTDDPEFPMRVSDTVKPLDVAIASGKLATAALAKRAKASEQDGMAFDSEEQQTVAGRVIGVVMRFDELERLLVQKTQSVGWIKKYNEWASFGVLEDETNVDNRIREDPLFAVNRAECLLALFLNTVEIPTLEKVKQEVAGGSTIDFIDADRLQVLTMESL
jgi:hypothetical protein